MDSGNWELIPRDTVLEGVTPVSSVWSMQCKHDLIMDKVVKYKACLNWHCSKQELGTNYFETYVSIMTWMAICFFFIVVTLNCWSMKQIDFIMTYTQALIELRCT